MATEDHGHHHLPAENDWPRGFGEASWWPFITAIGGSGFYIGAAMWVLGRSEIIFGTTTPGAAVFLGSTVLFVFGLYGWLYHAFVQDFWGRGLDHKHETKLRWGMIAFLGTEVATFGAIFVYYFFIRFEGPVTATPDLINSLLLINTAILLLSSVTIHYAHVALLNDNRKRFLGLMAGTFLLGSIFIVGQLYEYYEFLFIYEFGVLEGAFNNGFYALTGLHKLHVLLGLAMIALVTVRGYLGQYSAERHVSVSTVSMYWHFVDVVWVLVVVFVYAGAEFAF